MAESSATSARKRALVIGATGGIGHAVASALIVEGWQVRALHRDPQRASASASDLAVEWTRGDAMSEGDVVVAAADVDVVFHGANPPGYQRWRELAIPMLASAIAAAKTHDARLIFPGNVYNFGPDAGAVVDETSPQNPVTRKGKVRVEMERMLAAASEAGGRALVVRAGDFLGDAAGSWFTAVMVKPGRPVARVTYPGRRDVGHVWAYLPDLAETIVRLAEIERDLPAFETFHFGGHWLDPGVELCAAVRRVAGNPGLPIRSFPWILVYLASPFSTFMRELIEMRYLWQLPLRLDNTKLVARLGAEPHTPLDQAVAAVLGSMGALPGGGEGREQQSPAP
jgi:nucleoside-diphosphate-sugar epimerase